MNRPLTVLAFVALTASTAHGDTTCHLTFQTTATAAHSQVEA